MGDWKKGEKMRKRAVPLFFSTSFVSHAHELVMVASTAQLLYTIEQHMRKCYFTCISSLGIEVVAMREHFGRPLGKRKKYKMNCHHVHNGAPVHT